VIGRTASHYRILERLGGGGMGDVYLAEDTRLHRRVALKMMRDSGPEDSAGQARLLREARLASGLNHPGIAVIYEIDHAEMDDGWRTFIAMEYITGETLSAMAARDRPALSRVLEIAVQIADALTEAHARGVVHRDVKPSNVMITESGRVKVLDFGLAKYVPFADETGETLTRGPADGGADGALIGTIAYMSPEQALGGEVDARSDVFSLGVVIHELLSGRQPFQGANAVEMVDAILHKDPPSLVELDDPGITPLVRLLRRMLAKDPERRPQTMREVAGELEAIRRGGSPEHATAPAAAAAPAVAVMGFDNITQVPEDEWLGTGIAETVAADLRAVEGLTVISRERIHEVLRKLESAGAGNEQDLAVRLGRELGARWVLKGGYQRFGERVRVTARLTDVESGSVIRTVKIDGGMDEIFSVQDRIVAELSAGLRMTVVPGGRDPDETQVIEAYEAFSRGMINLRAESHESVDRAILFLERAIALDPSYAQAHLKLGSAYETKASYLIMPELYEKAIAQFRRAIELRPALVSAWRELGGVLVALCREDEGIEAIRHALTLDPRDAGAHATMGRAHFLGFGDFQRAAECYEKAITFNPQGGWYVLQLAHCYALLRDFARGEDAARRAVSLQEDFLTGREGILIVGAHMRLGHMAALQGRYEQAIEHFHREIAFLQRVDHALRNRILIELHQRLGSAHLRLGHAAEGAAALALALEGFQERLRLGADEPFSRYYAACAYAVRGDVDPALNYLERAIRLKRRFTIARARIEPEFDGLRGERRFRELVGDPVP
jgi:TolB-like protein/tRNA A-37 threonylcarbamoyl transferase component Bud32/Tfp pilus assembly protein PilF